MSQTANAPAPMLSFPLVNVLTIHQAHIGIMTHEGEIITHALGDRFIPPPALRQAPTLTCHAPWMASKLNLASIPIFDVLELFAFIYSGQFVTPTLSGIAKFLELEQPQSADDAPLTLVEACQILLKNLQAFPQTDKDKIIPIAQTMGRQGHGWAWTPYVLEALGTPYDPAMPTNPKKDMNIFEGLKEWAEEAPPPQHTFNPINGDTVRDHLNTLLKRREYSGRKAEKRAQQANYTTQITNHFMPKTTDNSPHLLIAQAGTGIGKTYGYLAPSQLWAEENGGCVTISTYTKNLQRQIEQDLSVLYPDDEDRKRNAIIQKGRENYLCLLNLEELITSAAMASNDKTTIAAGLMARWASTTPDGDFSGNSFPGWLTNLLGLPNTVGLADRRGECVYAACDHYHKCFIEGMNRRAKHARIVINNHALTMIRAATEASDATTPFIVFDEAHHLFHAADNAYGANLSGVETADLRRWLLGPEDQKTRGGLSSRGRGLRKRLEGLLDESSPAFFDVGKIMVAAKEYLPAPGWRRRVFNNEPFGNIEKFLCGLTSLVQQRSGANQAFYSIECDTSPCPDNMIEIAGELLTALKKLQKPLADLSENLRAMMEDKADELDKDTMTRLDSLSTSIERRSTLMVKAWVGMLDHLIKSEKPNDMIDWFEITRIDGKNYDTGYYRRFKNPMEPFGNSIRHTTHGVIMTSATIKSQKGESEHHWAEAEQSLGTQFMTDLSPTKIDLPSPFNYAEQSKIFIVTDVDKNNAMAVANAYKQIFEATNGGALGLFTSIQRLRQTYNSIRDALERQAIPLYAQHENDIDIGTLTDMFKDDKNACLLGTDAIRDGIDVSGESLRCMIFDRVPWPRPTILHRERRNIFGGRAYDENLTRLKLKQAYGRLIRSQNDKGVFILLDGATPTRLLDAFPENVAIERIKLQDVIKDIRTFL